MVREVCLIPNLTRIESEGIVDFELVWATAIEDIPGFAAFGSTYLNQ